jgi:hypothetical protein
MRKTTVEECLTLSLSNMLRDNQLTDHSSVQYLFWTNRDGEILLSLTVDVMPGFGLLQMYLRELQQRIYLHSTPLHFGGVRWWFFCPGCSRRRADLYLIQGKFHCRVCLDLAYERVRKAINSIPFMPS